MTALLDTHVLIWAGISRARLSRKAQRIISDVSNTILVSAASAWEIATKVRLGKMPEAVELEGDFLEVVRASGYTLWPIAPEDALRAGRLTGVHRDPFDRILAAQALARDIALISADNHLDAFGVQRVW